MIANSAPIPNLDQRGNAEAPDQSQVASPNGSGLNPQQSLPSGDLEASGKRVKPSGNSNDMSFDLLAIDQRLRKAVEARPWTAWGVAFLGGAFVGYRLWKRRSYRVKD